MPSHHSPTINPDELYNFESVADQWWDEEGPFKPLHRLNPVRMQYIFETCQKHFNLNSEQRLQSLTMLDVGCGGGLVAEPLTRLGATVTAIDAGATAIKTARRHAEQNDLTIDYRCGEVAELLREPQRYDVITALEIIEHLDDVHNFISILKQLLKPNGIVILSTLNRTVKSYILAIIGAEYILRWLPRGTHQWQKFIKPSELAHHCRQSSLAIQDIKGLEFNPLHRQWLLTPNIDVNYFMVAKT